MFRKRKQPTPYFRLPPPYNPIEGEHAPLQAEGVFPYCALMQVAAEDTHENYVLCRGFDIRINRFVDYEAGNANSPGIPVAKPYGNRVVGVYEVAQIFLAVLPLQTGNPSPTAVPWRIGQNPGVATVCTGHPCDLNETVDQLSTDEGVLINWMLVDSSQAVTQTKEALATLSAPMCPDDGTGTLTSVEMLDGDMAAPATAVNLFHLSGQAGALVKIKYRSSTGTWFIEQVEHRNKTIVVEDTDSGTFLRTGAGCQIEGYTLEESSVMSCEDPSWWKQFDGSEVDVLTDIDYTQDQSGCRLTGTTKTVCVLSAGDPVEVTVASLQEYTYVRNIRYSSNGQGTCGIDLDLRTFCGFGTPGEEAWVLTIPMHEVSVIHDLTVDDETCDLQGDMITMCIFDDPGDEPDWENILVLYKEDIVTNVSATEATENTCSSLQVTKRPICVFGNAPDPETIVTSTVLTFEQIQVVTWAGDDGTCAYLEFQAICVASVDQTVERLDLICGTDCVTSSSSATATSTQSSSATSTSSSTGTVTSTPSSSATSTGSSTPTATATASPTP